MLQPKGSDPTLLAFTLVTFYSSGVMGYFSNVGSGKGVEVLP